MKSVIALSILLVAVGAAAQAEYVDKRSLSVAAENLKILKIDCRAGSLEVEGIEGLDSILVEAEIVLEGVSSKKAEEFIEDNMELDLTTRGEKAELDSWFDNTGSLLGRLFGHGSALIDLTVKVPKNMAVDIDDGSGDTWVHDLGSDLNIDDGSGNIEVENIVGRVEIHDGSGKILVKHVTGNVIIDDGSGSIVINHVSQDVEIVEDGSGRRWIRNVGGEVIEP